MNCFMGYNPLVTKQVKVTVWVCEQDGATPVAPSNPSAGDCFIVYATDEAVLSNTPTSAKTYADGEWKDAEGGGGGGTTFPTFTNDSGSWSCDMTFTEALAVYNEKVLDDVCPCVKIQRNVSIWDMLFYNADKEAIDRDYDNVPTEVTAGLGFSNGNVLWGNDGNFYELKSA